MSGSIAATEKAAAGRGSRKLWLDAALEALVEGGVDAVKIQPLASTLNLSRTSFYWFFADRQALLAALLDEWNSRNTGGLISMTEAYAESPAEAALNFITTFLDRELFDPRLDFAVRGWALQDPVVMAGVKEADEVRLEALRKMLARHGYDAVEADVRARTMYLVQIGYISMQVRETIATRMKRIFNYVKTFTGQAPTEREMARFFARHGYTPDEDDVRRDGAG